MMLLIRHCFKGIIHVLYYFYQGVQSKEVQIATRQGEINQHLYFIYLQDIITHLTQYIDEKKITAVDEK